MVVNTDEAAAAVVQSLANVNATKAVAQDAADALKKGTDEAKTAREKVKEAEANAETARGAEKAAADDLTDKNEAAKLAFAAQATVTEAALIPDQRIGHKRLVLHIYCQ